MKQIQTLLQPKKSPPFFARPRNTFMKALQKVLRGLVAKNLRPSKNDAYLRNPPETQKRIEEKQHVNVLVCFPCVNDARQE